MRIATLLVLLTLSAFAQEDRIQVTATRTVQLKADEAILSINLLAPLTASLEGALQAVAPIGIKESDLTSVNQTFGLPVSIPPSSATNRISYSFTFKVPYSELNSVLQKIDQARRTVTSNDSGMDISGQGLLGLTASDKSRQDARAQLTTDAIAQARARATEIARAAGLTLGRLTGIDEIQTYSTSPLAPNLSEGITILARFATSQ
ncbi:MAG: SIMPL domain-containing protein [Bryobacteraceae bacterium]